MELQDKQIVANRENARRSTGPKTVDGKSTSRQNAVKHGLLVRIPVLPLIESQAEWDAHCERLQSCLTPAGCLETVLVEKVVLQLWRLKRLALYEREVTAIGLESVKEPRWSGEGEIDDDSQAGETIAPITAARQALKRSEAELSFIVGLEGRREDEAVDSALAAELIEGIAEDLDVDIYDNNDIEFPDYADGAALDSIKWTKEYLRRCLDIICRHGGSNLDTALTKRLATCRFGAAKAKVRVQSLVIEASRKKRQRILPNGLELEKITRYEAHLERSLYRALHELQRLQANRNGRPVPPPQVVDVDVAVGLSA